MQQFSVACDTLTLSRSDKDTEMMLLDIDYLMGREHFCVVFVLGQIF